MFCMFKFQFMKVNSLFLKCNRVKYGFAAELRIPRRVQDFPGMGAKRQRLGGANLLFSKPFAENGMNMK